MSTITRGIDGMSLALLRRNDAAAEHGGRRRLANAPPGLLTFLGYRIGTPLVMAIHLAEYGRNPAGGNTRFINDILLSAPPQCCGAVCLHHRGGADAAPSGWQG